MAMEDSMVYRNCETMGRFLDGKASRQDIVAVRYGICTSLCEIVLVSVKAMSLIPNGKR